MRRDTGLSVRAFADAAKMSASSYSYYEGQDFTSDEIRKGPRIKIAVALLRLNISLDRVAQLGKLPDEFDPTKAEVAALRRDLSDLRGEVAEIKSPRRSASNG